ncbi:hypothetical protein [Metabacillus mangrovi]|uniref:hypothetical protein n=1 Tax=Metabacillus mangrovi TaxID=1491830 RepID=UPI00240E3792|nr:hypothetical protein [Metabacillus mangrovi]
MALAVETAGALVATAFFGDTFFFLNVLMLEEFWRKWDFGGKQVAAGEVVAKINR